MQNRRAILFFAFAIVFGVAAAFAAQRFLERQIPEPTRSAVQTAPVVVARADVTVGTALGASQVEVVEWPERFVPKGAFSQPAKVTGRVARRALAAGEPVLDALLLPPGSEAGLVAVINDKARAVSVKVDPVIGVAGFVTPGARVDVLATLRRLDQSQKLPYSKVILQDIPVLAIDQRLEKANDGEPELVSVVTLEVTPSQAEELIYSAHEGRLQLALRSPADREVAQTRGVGAADLLKRPGGKTRVARASVGVQVLKGSDVSVKAF